VAYRIIQWGTGNVGLASLKTILKHPDYELVGCYVSTPSKAGRDAGEIAGVGTCGVKATNSIDEILALDADIVMHMPLAAAQVNEDPSKDTKDICALLRSGKNVVTTVGYVYPKAYGLDVLAELESACTAGSVSLHGTGVNPGFMAELVPLVFSSHCSSITSLLVRESSDFSSYPSPQIIFDVMGFSFDAERYESHTARYRKWLSGLFEESVLMMADGLGLELDELTVHSEIELAADDLDIAAGRVPKGTVAGQRWEWCGVANDRDVIRLEAIYKTHKSVAPQWQSPAWVCTIEGEPRLHFEANKWTTNGLVGTAMRAVHAIPAVCAAPTGVRTFLDLPLVAGRGVVAC
jgi:4-hydroxy-tetrahydrodipicolinate reductase